MRRKVWAGILAAEAALCVFLNAAQLSLSGAADALLGFPWRYVGMGLRWMSLSGGAGNAGALALYVLIGALPLAGLLFPRRRKLRAEDGLLAALSAAQFVGLYWLINPRSLEALLGAPDSADVLSWMLSVMINSVLAGYGVLRLVRAFLSADMARLRRYLSAVLAALSLLFVYCAFGAELSELLRDWEALGAGNTALSDGLELSYGMLALRHAVAALPWLLDVWVTFSAMRLLGALNEDPHSSESVAAAEALSGLCVRALAACVAADVALNLLQMAYLPMLRSANGALEFPLVSMGVALAALLLAQYIRENKRLKDENDMFV